MKKFFSAVFLFCYAVFFLFSVPAAAETTPYFSFSLSMESAESDELVKLEINAYQTADTAAGFRMMINYDDKVLSFVRTETSSKIKSGTMVTNSAANPICSVYVCNTEDKTAPELSGNIISFVFKVKDDAAEGKTSIGAHIDQVCNYQAKQLNLQYDEDLPLSIDQPDEPSDEAYLKALIPNAGKIRPDFSSDVFEYTMTVDYNVNSIDFAASAGEKGTVKVNRKTLGKAGTKTNIIATVTSADKSARTEYIITVNRAAAPANIGGNSSVGSASHKSTGSRTEESTAAIKQKKSQGKSKTEGLTQSAKKNGRNTVLAVPSGTDTAQESPENADTAFAAAQPAYDDRTDRNIYIMGSQMPAYVNGMLTAALCVMTGIALSFWLKIKPSK